ncbi:pirin family protein [Microbacteriaceae bacterium 4G12]
METIKNDFKESERTEEMIQLFPAASRYFANHGWVQSYFSFSFAKYYDPDNMMFGPLRVLNDDVVAPMRGFAMHPHHDMEIVSIVLDGYLKHEDSYGNSETTTFGEVQRMSAGTGIFHSEMNPSEDEEVNFLQLWILPNKQGLKPSYEKTIYRVEHLKNQLLPIVSHTASEGVAYIHQDITIYLSDLESGASLSFAQKEERRTFLFIIEGSLQLNKETMLHRRDSARITGETELVIEAKENVRFMLIDLP